MVQVLAPHKFNENTPNEMTESWLPDIKGWVRRLTVDTNALNCLSYCVFCTIWHESHVWVTGTKITIVRDAVFPSDSTRRSSSVSLTQERSVCAVSPLCLLRPYVNHIGLEKSMPRTQQRLKLPCTALSRHPTLQRGVSVDAIVHMRRWLRRKGIPCTFRCSCVAGSSCRIETSWWCWP